MKTKLLRFAALLAATSAALAAAPLTETTAVHTKPDRTSPTVTVLKAGTEPVAASAAAPAGWTAVELPGPFEAYVENKDLTKSLDVKPGASMRLAPNVDAGVLAVAEKGDKTTITGLRGRWTQVSLEKNLVGYIHVSGAGSPPIAAAPAPAPAPATGGALSPVPVTPAAYGVGTAGQPAPMVNLGDGGPSALPRQFAGKFVSTRRPLAPRRPYDWALNDDAGKRFAYLDVSKLLQTEQIEKYTNHQVVVFGTARASADGKELVIQIESLQLR